jgi:hypothetical protein
MVQYGAFPGTSSASQRQWSHAYVDYEKLKSILKPAKTTKDLLPSELKQELMVSVSTGFCAQLQLEIAKARNHLVDTERVLLETCDPRKLSFVTLPNLKELGSLISDLEEFRVVNYVAVLKAIKKHDKYLEMDSHSESMAVLEASPLPRGSPVLSDCTLLLQGALKELERKAPQGADPDEPLQGLPEECMICWDRALVALNLRCGHNFCSDCLEETAAHGHDSCPVCREPQPLDPAEVRIGSLLSNTSAVPEEYFPSTVFPQSKGATDRGPGTPLLLTSGSSPIQTPKPMLQPSLDPVNADETETARRELRESSWPMPHDSQSLMPTTMPPQPSFLQHPKQPGETSPHLIGQNVMLNFGQPQHGERNLEPPMTMQPMQHVQQPSRFGFGAAGAAHRDRSPDSSGDGEPDVRNAWKTRNQDPREVATRLAKESKTTIMLGNLPSTATTEMVMQAVQYLGFMEAVTFSFVPVNTRTGKCKGYGFVDVDRPEAAARLCLAIAGFHFPNSGQKRTQVSVADTQGTFATLWRLRPWTKKNAVIFETSSPPFVRMSEKEIGPITAEEAVTYLRPRARSNTDR